MVLSVPHLEYLVLPVGSGILPDPVFTGLYSVPSFFVKTTTLFTILLYSIHYSDHCATATFSKCFKTLRLCTGSAPQVRKVLICHASVGSGHSRAAQAWHPGGPGNRGSHDVNSFGPSCRWRASEGWTCQKVAYGKLVCLTG